MKLQIGLITKSCSLTAPKGWSKKELIREAKELDEDVSYAPMSKNDLCEFILSAREKREKKKKKEKNKKTIEIDSVDEKKVFVVLHDSYLSILDENKTYVKEKLRGEIRDYIIVGVVPGNEIYKQGRILIMFRGHRLYGFDISSLSFDLIYDFKDTINIKAAIYTEANKIFLRNDTKIMIFDINSKNTISFDLSSPTNIFSSYYSKDLNLIYLVGYRSFGILRLKYNTISFHDWKVLEEIWGEDKGTEKIKHGSFTLLEDGFLLTLYDKGIKKYIISKNPEAIERYDEITLIEENPIKGRIPIWENIDVSLILLEDTTVEFDPEEEKYNYYNVDINNESVTTEYNQIDMTMLKYDKNSIFGYKYGEIIILTLKNGSIMNRKIINVSSIHSVDLFSLSFKVKDNLEVLLLKTGISSQIMKIIANFIA